MTDGPDNGRLARAGELWRSRLWPLAVSLVVVAVVAVWINETGSWIGDNRFEQYENPGRRLARTLSVWDSSRGLGGLRVDFWPGVTVPLGLLRILGVSRAATEHLWHAALIATGGIGTAAFLRTRIERIGIAHTVAALLYMFGPYTVGFLLPSNLYVNYAVAPWIFVLFVRGLQSAEPWRAAAGASLIVFAVGNTEVAGLAYALLYLLPIAVFLVHVDRTTTWPRVIGLGARFGVLAVGVSAVTALTTVMGAEVFDQNLRETEAPTVLNGNSSWAESWRGLGNWLLYHIDSTGFSRPQILPYLSDPIVITASFVPVAAAVAMVSFGRGRERVLFGAMMIMGLTMMVGLYPLRDPSVYGRLLRGAYDVFPSLEVLRNNYKAGSGVMLSVACLAGMATSSAWQSVRARLAGRGPRARLAGAATVGVVVVLLLAAIAQPFWRGDLYPTDTTLEAVPSHVYDAAAWLDAQPEGGRVLVLPRAYRSEFRWGWVNDDVLDAYIARPHVIEVPIHLSRPVAADAIAALDAHLIDRVYEPGNIGRLARALGIEYVMIRNDHAWERWDQPRPASFSRLRADPALTMVASFGTPGLGTTAANDTSADAALEQTLPPIEIYRVNEPGTIVQVEAPAPEILVSGDGAALPQLASLGWLDAGPGLRFTGRLDPEELTEALEAGAPLVITDGNRRRVETITISAQESETLTAGQSLEREPYELFEAPGAESVADYSEATALDSSGPVAFGGGSIPWHRPAQAFDDDLSTTWLVGGLFDPVGETLRIELREPRLVRGVQLIASAPLVPTDRRLTGVTVTLSDGFVAEASLVDGFQRIDFAPRSVDAITITISATSGEGVPPVGLAEIDIFGAETSEWIVTPSDVALASSSHPPLADALDGAAVAYAFERSIGEGPVDEERTLRRRFTALRADTLEGFGRLRLQNAADDALLHAIAPTPIRVTSSNRLLGGVAFRPGLMADGDPDTGWFSEATSENRIDLTFETERLRTLRIVARHGQDLTDITEVRVEAGDVSRTATFETLPCDAPQCAAIADIDLPAGEVDRVTITVTGVDPTGADEGLPVRIDEVQLNGRANFRTVDPDAAPDACLEGLIQLDGRPLPVRLEAPRSFVFAGLPVPWRACAPIELARGGHDLSSLPPAIVDTAVLAQPGFPGDSEPVAPTFTLIDQAPTSFTVDIDAPDGGIVSIGQSWHPAWRASLDGVDLGPPIEVDTAAAWRLPPGTAGTVEVEFALQRWFDVALLITLGSAATCVWIVTRPRPSP